MSLHQYNFNCLFYDNPHIWSKNGILAYIVFSIFFIMCIITVLRNCQTEETKLVLACYCDHCSQIDLGLRVTDAGASRLQFTVTAVIRDLAYLVN